MRLVCVWKEQTDYAREVEEWLRDFRHIKGYEIESINPETIEGEIFVQAHDLLEYPTILALDDRGSVMQEWRGRPLPVFDEVASYML